jgi:murein DD-endopeptidase MepM/ murein hydrolase activator NlpD
MNIVSIMVELINRQKIDKRHSHDVAHSGSKSLLNNAASLRLDKQRFSRKKSRYSELKNLFIHKPKRRNIKVSKSAASGQKTMQSIAKRSGFKKSAVKVMSSMGGFYSRINKKILIITAAAAIAGGTGAFLITEYIEQQKLFESFALHGDVKIEDVLYESLPSDYDGRGSGEVAGIEPVLLTSGKPISYTVKSGDTLSEISKNNNIKIGTLISFNKISDVRRLQVGMELKIPEFDGVPYEVKAGDSLSAVSKKFNISINSILDGNNLDSDILQSGDILFIPGAAMNDFDYKKAMGTLFIYPTAGRLSSGFGYRPDPFTGNRRFHNGIDLANGAGTRINATMSGRVADVGDRPSGYGKYVIIKHSNGYQSLYGHMSRVTVREGQYIYQGSKIGEMGNTGRSTGPHLHFSVYKNNSPVNPLTYLW